MKFFYKIIYLGFLLWYKIYGQFFKIFHDYVFVFLHLLIVFPAQAQAVHIYHRWVEHRQGGWSSFHTQSSPIVAVLQWGWVIFFYRPSTPNKNKQNIKLTTVRIG